MVTAEEDNIAGGEEEEDTAGGEEEEEDTAGGGVNTAGEEGSLDARMEAEMEAELARSEGGSDRLGASLSGTPDI